MRLAREGFEGDAFIQMTRVIVNVHREQARSYSKRAEAVLMYSLEDLLHLMARLRDPQYGCPWDIKQTYKSIVPHTLEAVSYTHLTLPTTPYV